MSHLLVHAQCTGDRVTAISQCLNLAKAYGKSINLSFNEGFSITVNTDSNCQDLVQIFQLTCEKKILENKALAKTKT